MDLRPTLRRASRQHRADVTLIPLQLSWASGVHNTTFALGIVAPLGEYDVNSNIDLGRKYWSLDPTVSYT